MVPSYKTAHVLAPALQGTLTPHQFAFHALRIANLAPAHLFAQTVHLVMC